MNLILLHSTEITPEGYVRLHGRRATHLLNVLGVQREQVVRVGVLDGPLGTAQVVDVAADAVSLQCVFEPAVAPRPRVDLLLAMPRPKVLQRLWAQVAALGVGQVMLTNAERVERNYFDTHVLTPEVYVDLLIEGLQQAKDTHLPRVSVHRQFRVLVEDDLDRLAPATRRLVADPSATQQIGDALGGCDQRVLLAIGPEGGWNAFELSLLDRQGFARVGLGARTLRSDTACVALLAVVHDAIRAPR